MAGKPPKEPVQPETPEQSGSAGRAVDNVEGDAGKDTGQGRYGQTGDGGAVQHETDGQANYRKSDTGDASKERSNPGSGQTEQNKAPPR